MRSGFRQWRIRVHISSNLRFVVLQWVVPAVVRPVVLESLVRSWRRRLCRRPRPSECEIPTCLVAVMIVLPVLGL